MKKFEKIIRIEVEANQIAESLLSHMDNKFIHAENVVEAIIATMNEHGLSMLYNALNGFSAEVDFSIGQEVEVKDLHVYGFWTKESIESSNTTREQILYATICKIDVYSTEKIEVQYQVPQKDGTLKTERKWVSHLKCSEYANILA